MDIVVTVPKKEMVNIEKEDEYISQMDGHSVQFWSLNKKPKDLNVGDRVYFVENGKIAYYHRFLGYVYDPVCEVTGRVWHGLNLLLECPSINVDGSYPMKGFQGFHYIGRVD